MPQCPSGTQVAPGAPASFWVFDFPFLNYLSNKIPALASVIAALIGPELVITSTFCASEPVVPPAPTLADYAAALLIPGNMATIIAYWKAQYKASVFPTYCQCVPGGTPAGTLEAFIASTYAPINWYKFDDASISTVAHDSGSSAFDGGMVAPYAFNTPKICPNANGTCLTTSGGFVNIHQGGASALDFRTSFSVAGFFQTTSTSHGALLGNYASVAKWIDVGLDYVTPGKIYAWVRDSGGAQVRVDGTNTDFHNGQTHLFVFSIDTVAGHWYLWSDNGRAECNGVITSSAWQTSANLDLLDDQVQAWPYGGKAQDFFIYPGVLTQIDAQALWFNAGLGGGPVWVPPPEVVPPNLPVAPPVGPSCTTIADLCAELQVIFEAIVGLGRNVSEVRSQVDLLQEYRLPFAYRTGAVHSGLTGSGTVSLPTGLIGLRLELTTTRPGMLTLPGVPQYLWDCGWISVDDSGGMLEERRITRLSFEWFPEAMPVASSFGYALSSGFTLRVTELEAET